MNEVEPDDEFDNKSVVDELKTDEDMNEDLE